MKGLSLCMFSSLQVGEKNPSSAFSLDDLPAPEKYSDSVAHPTAALNLNPFDQPELRMLVKRIHLLRSRSCMVTARLLDDLPAPEKYSDSVAHPTAMINFQF